MEKAFVPAEWEEKIYAFWEKGGYLSSKKLDGKPFTILMPPPNANASLHAGHGMYSVDDVLIRWKRLNGFAAEWLPGMDHAGFETQTVYEKHLRKEGKSRFDFDRTTLYDNIFGFVKENSGLIYAQFKRLGFLADWDRSTFTLDPDVVEYVCETFKKMVADDLVYRDEYIVNYCPFDGTSLADLEVQYVERQDNMYYVRYPLVDGDGHIVVATVRPEPIFVDTHLAVNPNDLKHADLVGKKVRNPLTGAEMEIIADDFVDPDFGTGIVKLTPAHDHNDFEVARKHGLPIVSAVGLNGKMLESAGEYAGMKVMEAREKVVSDLEKAGLIDKIDSEYVHSVGTCYRCGRDIEPLTVPNWFVRVETLKAAVKEAVEKDEVYFHPAKFKDRMLQWLDVMHDWPISRQIVWGIRIPVWYKVSAETVGLNVSWLDAEGKFQSGPVGTFLSAGTQLEDIEKGLQKVVAQPDIEYVISSEKPGDGYVPETDTFDTWFSSGQWPLVTMKDSEYETRFPTDFIGTLSDILKFWISRMMMFSLYRRGEVPFKHVYLWSQIVDAKGQKMSKSKGNVINPIELVDKFGADAFRGALFFGTAQGGKIPLSEDKVKAMRNYANKMWNIGRFILLCKAEAGGDKKAGPSLTRSVMETAQTEFLAFHSKAIKDMEAFHFSRVFDDSYEFIWHRLADCHIEQLKESMKSGNIEILDAIEEMYIECVKIAHPFMPFVTEAIYKSFYGEKSSILDSRVSLK